MTRFYYRSGAIIGLILAYDFWTPVNDSDWEFLVFDSFHFSAKIKQEKLVQFEPYLVANTGVDSFSKRYLAVTRFEYTQTFETQHESKLPHS